MCLLGYRYRPVPDQVLVLTRLPQPPKLLRLVAFLLPNNLYLVNHHVDASAESLHGHQLVVARIGLATGIYVQIRVAASIHGDCARDTM